MHYWWQKIIFFKVWLVNLFWSSFGFDRRRLDFAPYHRSLIVNNPKQPKISIIIVTYNNLVLTTNCLNSIFCFSHYPNLEIIVIDNHSTDGTKDYLKQLAKENSQIHIIVNDQNRGFAAANNQGIKIAQGEYIVFLNNDTIVTPDWLEYMINHFRQDSTIGLLGPVTNNIGNSAKIKAKYRQLAELIDFSNKRHQQNISQKVELPMVALFCAMIKKTNLEKIGGLSEDYQLGYFEDNDLCQQIKQLSLKIVCVQDVFIHHIGGASFSKLPFNERQHLWQKNLAIYEKKWGKWKKN